MVNLSRKNRYNFDGVYTLQLVVCGRYGFVGRDGREASAKAASTKEIALLVQSGSGNGLRVVRRVWGHQTDWDQNTRAFVLGKIESARKKSHWTRSMS